MLRPNPAHCCTQGMKLAPAATAVAVGLLLRYAAPIPEGLTDQVGPPENTTLPPTQQQWLKLFACGFPTGCFSFPKHCAGLSTTRCMLRPFAPLFVPACLPGLVPLVVVCCCHMWLHPVAAAKRCLGLIGCLCGPPDAYTGIQGHVCCSQQHGGVACSHFFLPCQGRPAPVS